jgi:hypothetical protein
MVLNRKSKLPKNRAVAIETPSTTKVYLIISFLVGQLTFFISSRISLKKTVILLKIFMALKKALDEPLIRGYK